MIRRVRLIPAVLLACTALAFAGRCAAVVRSNGSALTTDPDRLGHSAEPLTEDIRLAVDADSMRYSGSVRIALRIPAPTHTLRFHARRMTFDRLTLRAAGRDIACTVARHDTSGLVELTTHEALLPGVDTLAIDFTQAFDTTANALYRLETGGHAYAFTQFESAFARDAFPCWDEPEFKIPFTIAVTVPSSHLALSNSPVDSRTIDGARMTYRFAPTPPMPTYLLALATGPLDTVQVPGTSIPCRVVTVQGQTALAAEAIAQTPRLLAALERYFGQRYPYAKLDLLAVPEYWAGAMENPGAVTFVDNVLLLDPHSATAERRHHLAGDLAHELAHMWFGDMVTPRWWDDLWLNEAFASWLGDRTVDEVYPEFHAGVGTVQGLARPMDTDARGATRAIRQPVRARDNIDDLFDELVYDKGDAVLGMFEAWLGTETFRTGVRAYLRDHAWGTATAADFFAALSQASGHDVGTAMSTFLDQGGLPRIAVERTATGVRLRQSRFLGAGVTAPAQRWQVPVSLAYATRTGRHTTTLLLADSAATVATDGGAPLWVYPNAGETGYYRWSLPPDLLTALLDSAGAALSERERIGVLGNLRALLDAGALHGDAYLAALRRFSADDDVLVIESLCDALRGAHERLVEEAAWPAYAQFTREVLAHAAAHIGRAARPGDDDETRVARSGLLETLADQGDDASLQAYADSLAHIELADPAAVDADLRGFALRIAAQHGDSAFFDACAHRLETTRVPEERQRLVAALGSVRAPAMRERALAYALDGPLRPQEVLRLPFGLAFDERSTQRVYEWVTAHYDAIAARVPPYTLPQLTSAAEGCSEARLAAAQTFFAQPAHDAPGTREELAKVAERVHACTGVRAREGEAVRRFLRL